MRILPGFNNIEYKYDISITSYSCFTDVSTWREGGGSGILQTSPPLSPTNQSAQTSGTTVGGTLVVSSGNSSSPTESANISTNVGMSRDEVTTQDDGRACQEVQKVAAPANGQVPAHITVRPGLQPGVNKWMEFQTPTIPYPGMMMPPYVSCWFV